MTIHLQPNQHNALQEVAAEYQQQGFSVIVAPSKAQLPEFLHPFQPSMLVFNPSLNIVVEVRTRASLGLTPKLDQIADAVAHRANWRFDLAVVNSDGHTLMQYQGQPLLDDHDIDYRLQEARLLSAQEHGEAALLLTWSTLEALLRRGAAIEDVPVEQDNPAHLIKSLFIYGLLDQEQYKLLKSGVQARNTIVHGYKNSQPSVRLLDDLLLLANQLVVRPLIM